MSKKKIDIDRLVEKSKSGDAAAFGQVYDELVKPVYRYIYYRVEESIAEDLTEDAFLKAWQNLKKYKKGKCPFSSWVFRIAHNLVVDHYRKNRIVTEISDELPDTKEANDPARQANVKLTKVRLRKVIRHLPNNYQQVILLKYVNDLNNKEIAVTIGKSEAAVRTIQFRALEKLRSMLDKNSDFL